MAAAAAAAVELSAQNFSGKCGDDDDDDEVEEDDDDNSFDVGGFGGGGGGASFSCVLVVVVSFAVGFGITVVVFRTVLFDGSCQIGACSRACCIVTCEMLTGINATPVVVLIVVVVVAAAAAAVLVPVVPAVGDIVLPPVDPLAIERFVLKFAV